MMKLAANKNFAKNVVIVAFHMCLSFLLFSDSSEKCIPIASDNASATAITSIPDITTSLDPVPAFNPTISPNVVTTPDASPKLSPFFVATLNFTLSFSFYNI